VARIRETAPTCRLIVAFESLELPELERLIELQVDAMLDIASITFGQRLGYAVRQGAHWVGVHEYQIKIEKESVSWQVGANEFVLVGAINGVIAGIVNSRLVDEGVGMRRRVSLNSSNSLALDLNLVAI